MTKSTKNIYTGIPQSLPIEFVETILQQDKIRIERIISKGHTTPAGEWYDQDFDEWVMLIQGNATLRFAENNHISLVSGDYLLIPAHTRHRVEWTDPDINSIWLAIHFTTPTNE